MLRFYLPAMCCSTTWQEHITPEKTMQHVFPRVVNATVVFWTLRSAASVQQVCCTLVGGIGIPAHRPPQRLSEHISEHIVDLLVEQVRKDILEGIADSPQEHLSDCIGEQKHMRGSWLFLGSAFVSALGTDTGAD